MARTIERLSPLKVAKLAKAGKRGMWCDGGGLYLHVGPTGGASWILRYMLRGKARSMGLGPYPLFGLSEARDRARTALKMKYDGVDPLEAKHAERRAKKLEAAKAITFKQAAEKYIAAHKAGWKNGKHQDQWTNTLATYAEPVIGSFPVAEIDNALVLKVLEPIWITKPETASRLRGRIESILDWARVRGYRQGENPARWKGHLDKQLAPRGKVRRIAHHAALPYRDMFEFMNALREQEGIAARALEFAILTAARTGEVIGATWAEIDLAARVWTVPRERMKGAREHRVPLSVRAIEILKAMQPDKGRPDPDTFVFEGRKPGTALSNMSLLMTLRRMGRSDVTAHGFRSSFRDWCAECTAFPSEVAEMALAHAVGDKVEAAYRRSDLFEKRRRLADEWAEFCNKPYVESSGNVVQLREGVAS